MDKINKFVLFFRVGQLLNSTDIWLMPSMNPDGFETAKEGACDPMYAPLWQQQAPTGRENAHNQDLNRNFPDQFRDANLLSSGDHRSLFTGREPETVAVMKWIMANPFVLSGEFFFVLKMLNSLEFSYKHTGRYVDMA